MAVIETLISLGMFGIFIIVLYLIWDKSIKVDTQHSKYIDLYKLYKLNEQLKERGLSFESLDKFEEETFKRKTALDKIDVRYNTKDKKAK